MAMWIRKYTEDLKQKINVYICGSTLYGFPQSPKYYLPAKKSSISCFALSVTMNGMKESR